MYIRIFHRNLKLILLLISILNFTFIPAWFISCLDRMETYMILLPCYQMRNWNLVVSQPYGPSWPVTGIALPLPNFFWIVGQVRLPCLYFRAYGDYIGRVLDWQFDLLDSAQLHNCDYTLLFTVRHTHTNLLSPGVCSLVVTSQLSHNSSSPGPPADPLTVSGLSTHCLRAFFSAALPVAS
jgi:hypothetical protein